MSISTTFKPSPLSFGSPRASPFRRPDSPASPSTVVRATTPTPSPTKVQTPTPPLVSRNDTPATEPLTTAPKTLAPVSFAEARSSSPTRPLTTIGRGTSSWATKNNFGGDALGRLDPARVRELREAFQMLDRDGDGLVGREDVVSILNDLGQDSGPAAVSNFFGAGSSSQKLTLPEFLNQLSTLLAAMSRPDELMSAFGAFDDDDNGQINVADLCEALLNTPPEPGTQMMTPLSENEIQRVMGGFTGRKTFGKKGLGHGEVFRYQEFIAAVTGVGEKQENRRA
ncbi:MAG: hypothetical protein M1816_008109 [Peltula sp. TS41687]|nr:MAG: hypothetical protein M1816_008109 [Peltula sp. TS41687]